MTARVVLLVTSPRLPAGLLTAAAWDVVRANPVFAGAESELTTAVRVAGAEVTVLGDGSRVDADARPVDPDARPVDPDARPVEALLAAAAEHGTAVWLAGPSGDETLARELGLRLAREPGLAELELMYGSWDPPGARLLDAVAVMDRLLSPGGDPWKREQTHATLARFLLEECYEAYDAIGAGDLAALREELGDVLLQVVLHARLAEELPEDERWSVDDVAGGLVDKMVRRNPHVFAGAQAGTVEEITASWEEIKKAEKARDSVLDGIALSQPALALTEKILERAARAGLDVPQPEATDAETRLGASLLAIVAQSRAAGLDAEAALRRAALAYADAVRAAEREVSDNVSGSDLV
ncbi:nucleoside triphosphate pyrophosphohydrolase [Micromonospora polyrhachis]|uniref:XTP/dITP diphosphohydrolase n=1 Tax=Micromonospora polyrhachis TaxID=1282883 RepID=A0A7W7WNY9_9ACTN|nr:nucleoside triphosphate pyrophosphohydrolase [Micromonospora polyrhachis]MBB4958084.1 XTP/dITP diphosphohydrolase [Micromonospora polyrhachis]